MSLDHNEFVVILVSIIVITILLVLLIISVTLICSLRYIAQGSQYAEAREDVENEVPVAPGRFYQ
jgi:heme/copper-type cytochrome/quinol oxidase subunit 2